MKIFKLSEHGYDEALLGLSLNHDYNLNIFDIEEKTDRYKKFECVARMLATKDGGHNKFLESINVWLLIDAPRYWWQQFDTYRVGVTKQSQSTMYKFRKGKLVHRDDFATVSPEIDVIIRMINFEIGKGDFEAAKQLLPESFIQKREVCVNYKSLRNMYKQRHNHKLSEWKEFCDWLIDELEHPEFMG